MSDESHGEAEAELASQLRRAMGKPPYDAVDWEALARRIHIAALGRRAAAVQHRWWDHAAAWTRAVIPLAVAAGIAAVVLMARDRSTTQATEPPTLMEAVAGGVPDQDIAVSMVGQPTTASFAAEVLAQ